MIKTSSFIVYILAFFVSFQICAFEVQIRPLGDSGHLVEEGKIFEAKLISQSSSDLSEADFNGTNKENFSEYFFFLESEKISELEYKVRLLLKQVPTSDLVFKGKLGEKEFDLKINGFQFSPARNLPKDFIIQDQKENWGRFFSKETFLVICGMALVLAYPLFRISRKYYLRKKAIREKKQKKEYWQSFFHTANSREQFEEIGKRRLEWRWLLSSTPNECVHYFSILEEHQYKKEISEEELQQIKQALNGMKNVFERFGI